MSVARYAGRAVVTKAFESGFARLVFVTGCYPNEEACIDVIMAMQESGCVDIVEIGVPFSDPVADGPIIERCALDSIANGCTSIWKVIAMVEKLRERGCTLPLMLMGYFNSFLDGWVAKSKGLLSGAIIVDLPFEEPRTHEVVQEMRDADMTFVPIVTSHTSAERLPLVCSLADTFLYCMSSKGVTGMRSGLEEQLRTTFRPTWEMICAASGDTHKIIGFGISNNAAVRAVKELGAGGLVVGSAMMKVWKQKKI